MEALKSCTSTYISECPLNTETALQRRPRESQVQPLLLRRVKSS